MSVGRICVRDVDLADSNESVWQAAERMHQRTVGTLVVVNDANEPIGMLTDRDLVERIIAQQKDPNTTNVGQAMTHDPKTIPEESSIESALSLMRTDEIRRLPVVDREGKLVGLLSLDDVLMLLAEEFTEIGRLLEGQTPSAAAQV